MFNSSSTVQDTQVCSFPIQHIKKMTFTFDASLGQKAGSGKLSTQQVPATGQIPSPRLVAVTMALEQGTLHLEGGNNTYLTGVLQNVIEIIQVTVLDPK